METAALVLGIVGTITGALSLGWNIAAHFLTAGRIRVELLAGWTNAHTYATGSIGKPMKRPAGEFTTQVLVVTVTNIGRLPTTVIHCAVAIGEARFATQRDPRNPAIPARVEIGDEARFFFDASDIARVADAAIDVDQISGIATIAGGKPKVSTKSTTPEALHAWLEHV